MIKQSLIVFMFSLASVANAQSYFGEKINASDAVSFETFLEQAQTEDSLNIKVQAVAREVCQVKGCWMQISGVQNAEPTTMVKFKDYGFFVPKDISGQEIIIEGVASTQFTSVEELRHYAEDAGKSKEEIEKITEGVYEITFLASGVIVLD